MSKSYRLVVFDWEGTLADTVGQVLDCVAIEAARLCLGEFNKELARQSVGFGLAHAIKKVFPHLLASQYQLLLEAVQDALVSHHGNTYLIPGAKEVVTCLYHAGIHLAIATNKGQHSLQRALQASGLDVFFKVTRSAGQAPAKPCPRMLEEILVEYVVSVEEALMIGDSLADIEMAKCIGVDAFGVDFYHQQSDILRAAGALAVFDDYQQLADYFNCSAYKKDVSS